MAVEARRALVWGTAAAAVASALLLTSNGGGLPRFSADMRSLRGEALAPPALPNRDRTPPAPATADRTSTLPLPDAR